MCKNGMPARRMADPDDPKVLAMAIITNPQRVYYGGQVSAPIVRQLFENILPYLEKMDYSIDGQQAN